MSLNSELNIPPNMIKDTLEVLCEASEQGVVSYLKSVKDQDALCRFYFRMLVKMDLVTERERFIKACSKLDVLASKVILLKNPTKESALKTIENESYFNDCDLVLARDFFVGFATLMPVQDLVIVLSVTFHRNLPLTNAFYEFVNEIVFYDQAMLDFIIRANSFEYLIMDCVTFEKVVMNLIFRKPIQEIRWVLFRYFLKYRPSDLLENIEPLLEHISSRDFAMLLSEVKLDNSKLSTYFELSLANWLGDKLRAEQTIKCSKARIIEINKLNPSAINILEETYCRKFNKKSNESP